MSEEDTRRVLGLLYQEDTLRVLSALVLTGRPEDAGLDPEATRRALDRLERGGLATPEGSTWHPRRDRFRELLHATKPDPTPATSPEDRVIQTFLVEGRLRAIPTRRDKRLVILDHIARLFDPGVRYSEKDVNVALRAFHDDYAALRRYLVDEGLLDREDNVYWRSGGSVDI
ncbi:DUF2087 domain-containing protein [Sphaerisporangium rubeum]|uniref:DUF2087 domain-containing protein n=1 Tax=Sphaerisporangium rubeum TaxID=321317 RepID=A0A7X0IEV9_9ACTN|nr:DUF2087 domain-containing protein [Sphaerisporangium rubeum]MBB6473693.1 hypothetical protein [Sphaerisporangium rubeum]